MNGTLTVNVSDSMPETTLQKSEVDAREVEAVGMDAEPSSILLIEPQSPGQTSAESDGSLTPQRTAVINRSPKGQPISPTSKFNNLILKLAASTPPAKEAKEKLLLAVEKLISDGASLDCTDSSRRTPLHRACASGTRDMIALLLRHGPELKGARDRRGNTPLHVVCSERRGSAFDLRTAVSFFIDAGVDVNCVNEEGVTALHLIAERGEEEWISTVELLLQNGAQIGLGDGMGKTALHKATVAGCAELVEALLQNGAAVDAVDDLGHSALHMCVVSESLEAMEVLLRYGADVNLRDGRGHTVLHLVCRYGWVEAVDMLMENGADVEIKDQDGLTALQLAKETGAEELVEALQMKDGTTRGRSRSPAARPANGETDDTADPAGQTGEDKDDDGASVGNTVEERLGYNHADEAREETENEVNGQGGRVGDKVDNEVEDRIEDRVEDIADKTAEDRLVETHNEQQNRAEEARNTTDTEAILVTDEATTEEGMTNGETRPAIKDNMLARRRTRSELTIKGLTSREETRRQDRETTQEIPIQAHPNLWAGVQRDNGDGFTLARYDNHDISFDAKLESIRPIFHEGRDMHEVQIKLNFMRPYSMDHRIRYAKVDVNLDSRGSEAPNIRGIMPQADRMEVSEQEITSGKTFTVGASGSGGPSNVNISMEGSKSKRSTFKGVRIIHGAIRDRMHASWRLYEEPGSRSGLPEIVRLLLLIYCETEFDIRLALSVKACHFLTFGIPRTLSARPGPSYTVPTLDAITAHEHSLRLRQMLDVADRAATMIEESGRIEDFFSRAMREHKIRHLIMNGWREDALLHEWSDILEDVRTNDFTALRSKLLDMDRAERLRLEPVRRGYEPEDDVRRVGDAFVERSGDRGPRPRSWERSRRVSDTVPFAEIYESDSRSASPSRRPRYRERYRASTDDYSEPPRIRVRHGRPAAMISSYRGEYTNGRGDGRDLHSGNPLENFTAVGPGYHISRLA